MPPAFLTATVVTVGKCFGVVVPDNEIERLVPASKDKIAGLAPEGRIAKPTVKKEETAWGATVTS